MGKNDAVSRTNDQDLLFRVLLENSTDIILHANTERQIVYASPAIERIMGFTVEEVLGKRLREFIYEEDLPRLLAKFESLITSPGTSSKQEYRVKKKQGGFAWMEGTLTNLLNREGLSGFVINQHDITERKQKEQELLTAYERFDYVARATNDAIWDWNLETGAVMRTGHGLKTNFGYDPEEASRDNDFWTNKLHPEDREAVLQRRTQALENPQTAYWDDEYRIVKADGSYAYIYDKGYIIRNEAGKAIRMIGATQDITRRRSTEALLVELNTRLKRRAEELAASNIELERFAYVASHDLQEPLRMVTSFLQLFRKKYQGQIDETADQYIHYAVDGAERMKKLILDLLEYSRIGSNRDGYEQVDLNALLGEVCRMYEKQVQETGALLNIQHLPVVSGNKTLLFQLFQNLIGNALKYRSQEMPEIQVEYREEAEQFLFSIRDNGIGIDPAYYEKIFHVFQRLHNKSDYQGTGIGLAICKKIVERHGGNIWVESGNGRGSCFYFTISKTA